MIRRESLGPRPLERLAPGFYRDDSGSLYFYLTGMYAHVAERMLENPLLNTPAFVADVLEQLREELLSMPCTELLD